MSELNRPSKFTLGTVQLGVNYGMANQSGKPSQEAAFEILNTAHELGVHSLDTAAAYGTSEQVVGDWLRAEKKPTFVVSKFKIFGKDGIAPLDELERQIVNSVDRIGQISGYMFHDADQMRNFHEILRPRLERMKEEQKMTFVGASVYTPQDVEDFLKIGWLGAIQIPMSVLDTRVVQQGLLQELKSRGVLVFVRSVFMQGMLCMPEPPEKFSFMKPSLDALREIAAAEGISLMQLAVSYIRDLDGVDSLVLGCEKAEQVRANVELVNGKQLSASATDAIMELGKKVPIEHCMQVILGKA